MVEERKRDPARDQSNNTPHIYLRTLWCHRSNLEEIVQWESINTAWVESLPPE
jgi:hypothetical protein